jgi:protein O-GlcNAc transferase
MSKTDQMVERARSHFHGGDYQGAAYALEEALSVDPDHGDARFGLGLALLELAKLPEAEACFRDAIARAPEDAALHYNLGLVLRRLGRTDEALESYRSAIRWDPYLAEAHTNIGNILLEEGQPEKALASYEAALARNPGLAEARLSKGIALQRLKRPAEALPCYESILRSQPAHVAAMFNMGVAYQDLRNAAEAAKRYMRALQLDPSHVDAWYNLGNAQHELGRLDDAVNCYRKALSLKADHSASRLNLGKALADQGRLGEAAAEYQAARALTRDSAAYYNLGHVLTRAGRLREWLENFESFEAQGVQNVLYWLYGLSVGIRRGEFAREKEFLLKLLDHGFSVDEIGSLQQLLSQVQYFDVPHDRIFSLYQHHNRLLKDKTAHHPRFDLPPRDQAGRLRVGYVSPDFRDHVMGMLMSEVLRRHDPGEFEVYCYSLSDTEDDMTRRFRELSRKFVVLKNLPSWDAAKTIAADDLDVLVDLAGHTDGANPEIYAYKPARVQITHLGYHGALGADMVDFKLTDHFADTPENQVYLIERLLPMDGCVLPLRHVEPAQEHGFSRGALGLPDDAVVIGAFVNILKLSQRCLSTWRRVLERVENSRLAFSPFNSAEEEFFLKRAAAAGIDGGRIVFVPAGNDERESRARYAVVDIVLDTFPYSGGDTTLAAVDMAVPVVTLCGQRHSERVSYSILMNLGLSSTIAHSEDEFVEIAARLGNDATLRSSMREQMRASLPTSVLTDVEGYTRNLETAYRRALALKSHVD